MLIIFRSLLLEGHIFHRFIDCRQNTHFINKNCDIQLGKLELFSLNYFCHTPQKRKITASTDQLEVYFKEKRKLALRMLNIFYV